MKKTLLVVVLIGVYYTNLFTQNISVTELGRYVDGRDGACEISAYDETSKQLFVTNAVSDSIDIINVSDLTNPSLVGGVNVLNYGGGVNSVVVLPNGFFAAAIEANVKQDSGKIVFFKTDGSYVTDVKVGALPDMLTVTKDGNKVLVANEGEPSDDYLTDPDGSISIIDISGGVMNVNQSHVKSLEFTNAPDTITGSIRKPNTSYSKDLEPEYVAVNENSTVAVVGCQENNVFVLVDLIADTILDYKGLGFKDHSATGAGMDVSNKDDIIDISLRNVKGVYQPDGLASYSINGETYWLSANEGDARDYAGYSSEVRIKDLILDTIVFPNVSDIQKDSLLGRLKTFTMDVIGDTDNDGDVDELYSYGARSFSIWNEGGDLVWDSGDDFEQYIAANHSDFFNCDDGLASEQDGRSDDKGPEPEAITVGEINNKFYAFIGLERQGGIMVYDISDPAKPDFETYVETIDNANGTMTDIAPEGLVFVPTSESHTGENLLIVSNEVSGTVTIYKVNTTTATDVSELENTKIDIYPNPASEFITVRYDEPVNFELLNLQGEVLKNGKLNGEQQKINLNDLSNGIYFFVTKSLATEIILSTHKVTKL